MSRPERHAQHFLDVELRRRRARELLAQAQTDVELVLRALPKLVPALWRRCRGPRRA